MNYSNQTSFPLNDIQLAYFMGRDESYNMGGVSAHVYYVFEGNVDKERYEKALNKVIMRQDMLRAVIRSDAMQYILDTDETPYYHVEEVDISELSENEQKRVLNKHREKQSHYIYPLDKWPFFSVVLYRTDRDKTYLCWSVDLMIADGSSLMILLKEIDMYYNNMEPEVLESNYREFVEREQEEKESKRFLRDKSYWEGKLDNFSLSPNILRKSLSRKSKFKRKIKYINKSDWSTLKDIGKTKGLSPTVILGTAYAEILSYWSGMDAFTINMTFTKKKPNDKRFENIIGDFTSSLLIQLKREKGFNCSEFWDDASVFSKEFLVSYFHTSYNGILFGKDIAKKNNIIDEPIMPIVFTSMLFNDERFNVLYNSCGGTLVYGISQTPQVYLDCQVMEIDGKLSITWDFAEDILDETMIDTMFEQYITLIQNIKDNKSKITYNTFSDSKTLEIYSKYNKTNSTRKSHILYELLSNSLQHYSLNTAVNDGEIAYTYAQLDKLSNTVACNLQKQGIGPGKKVAVHARRCANTIVNILAVIKTGAAYIPINPEHPLSRRNYIMDHAECRVCLYPEDVSVPSESSSDLLWSQVTPKDPAYVIYTSGSTGEPKGVLISNSAICNTVEDINTRFNINSTDVFIGISSFCFDLSVYDVLGALSTGACLMLIKNEKNISEILNCIIKYNVTVWNTVPAFMELLLEEINRRQAKTDFWNLHDDAEIIIEDFGMLKTVMLSGDWISLNLPERIKSIYPNVDLYSLGGATEAAVWSIFYPIKDVEPSWSSIPYGYPLSNQTFYVLDGVKRLCPCGIIGELYIGGIGLADGYLNDAKKTEEAFIIHPELGRLYKTGDYGVLTEYGYIDFKGRRDFQVKIRGHRIELGEIENVLNKCAGVESSLVSVYKNKFSVDVLCAYVVMSEKMNEDKLITWCEQLLPDYMIPSKFIQITKIPLTANGKVNRKSLPDPNNAEKEIRITSQISQTEERVLSIWKKTLKTSDIDLHDNYFEVGGDSIAMMRIINTVESEYNIKISMHDFLVSNTVNKMAELIERLCFNRKNESSEEKPYTIIDKDGRYKEFQLTDVQVAYLLGSNETFEMGGVAAQSYYEIITDYNPRIFEKVLNQIIRQQAMLRTVFTENLMQKVLNDIPYYKVLVTDLSGDSSEEQKRHIEQVRLRRSCLKYDIHQWPLFSIEFIKIKENTYHLMINFNLLIADGTSMRILIKDLIRLYKSEIEELSPMEFTFRDYINCKEETKKIPEYKNAEKYWKNKLKTIPPAPKLVDKAKAEGMLSHHCTRLSHVIDTKRWKAVKELVKENGVTPSAFLCTLYAMVLSYWSNQQNLTLNITVFNRQPYHEDVVNMIGDFTSVMLIDVMLKNKQNLVELVNQVQKTLLNGLENQIYDGINVVREYAKMNGISGSAVMPYVFTSMIFNDDFATNFSIEDFGQLIYSVSQTPQVYLDCQVMDTREGLFITWDYVDELFDSKFISTIFNQFIECINVCVDKNSLNTDLTTDVFINKDELWTVYNNTDTKFESLILAEFIKNGLQKDGEKTAVADGEKSLTYRQLDTLSNEIAAYLAGKEIGAGDYVGVLASRDVETIVNIIGTVKSGAAYVPINEDYPEQRKSYIIHQSKCRELLTKNNVDINSSGISEFYPARPTGPSNHAYVIYTSGSTGEPKGVVITNESVCNTIRDVNERFNINSNDKFIGISSFCFDLSVYDIFGSISKGCTLIIESDARDIIHMIKVIQEQQITVWNTVPAIMELVVNEFHKRDKVQKRNYWNIDDDDIVLMKEGSLKTVLLSGDWIPLDLFKKIKTNFEDADVYSLGGATEASIWSIYYPITEIKDTWSSIPYGYPLENQQIYVLNYEDNLCPVGVTGEIYIGGQGVAVGYLNDKARTDAMFINHKEFGRIYRTGDYGRLTTNGYIEFLGRKDNQVKINGHRIELGEIENVIRKMPSVENVAVVTQKNKSSKNAQLVAYVISNNEVDFDDLQKFIGEYLPKYMIPKYYMKVSEIVLTSNGKVDKSGMPEFEIESSGISKVRPRTEVEIHIATAITKVLECEELFIDDNFYDLGSDSIKSIQIYSQLHESYDIKITDIFEFPTCRLLAAKIEDELIQKINIKSSDAVPENAFKNTEKLEAYKELVRKTKLKKYTKAENFSSVLITGTTGYLGVYVLENYLKNTDASIITIVRADSDEEAIARLKENYRFYFDEDLTEMYKNRIKVLKGDLGLLKFGLDNSVYTALINEVDLILNCAADTSHFGNYSQLNVSNVESVANIIEFMRASRAKLCHISTSQVHIGFKTQYKEDYFLETDKFLDGNFEDYYSRSKYNAEKHIFNATDIFNRVMVLRVGNVSCCRKNGKFQKNIEKNAAYSFMKMCFDMRAVPVSDNVYCDFSFVDDISEAIRLLASSSESYESVYHVTNNKAISLSGLAKLLSAYDEKVVEMEPSEFKEKLNNFYKQNQMKNYMSVSIANINVINFEPQKSNNIILRNEYTEEIFDKLGFSWNEFSHDIFTKMISYMEEINFLNV